MMFLTYPKLIGHARIMRGTIERENIETICMVNKGMLELGMVVQICTQLSNKKEIQTSKLDIVQ